MVEKSINMLDLFKKIKKDVGLSLLKKKGAVCLNAILRKKEFY